MAPVNPPSPKTYTNPKHASPSTPDRATQIFNAAAFRTPSPPSGPNPFKTPSPGPYAQTRPPIPHTPGFKKRKLQLDPFEGKKLDRDSSEVFPIPAIKSLNHRGKATLPGGETIHCIKQPPQKQSCGAGAVLMLLGKYADLYKEDIGLEQPFWDWYHQATLTNIDHLIDVIETKTNANKLGYTVKGLYLQEEAKLAEKKKDARIDYIPIEDYHESILSVLAKIQGPMIVSITNPIIEGHWIILDKIEGDTVYIRDPYEGEALEITLKELYENWASKDEVKAIYLLHSESTAKQESESP